MPDLPANHDWSAVISELKTDRARLFEVLSSWGEAGKSGIHFHPSFICVVLYRVSHYLFGKRRSFLARLVGQFNELVTGAEINPASEIGAGLVVLCPPGTALYGKAGRNLTVMHCAGIGGEIGRREDVGGGPGLPMLGDDVVLEPHSGILGPQKIGNRVRVGGSTLVVRDIPDDTFVEGPRPRLLARRHSS